MKKDSAESEKTSRATPALSSHWRNPLETYDSLAVSVPLAAGRRSAANSSMRSSHRSRPKARKPRYVSLRRHLAPPPPPLLLPPPDPSDMSSSAAAAAVADDDEEVGRRGDHQLDLFPLHPEHLDRDPHVAFLLDDRAGGIGVPTLAAILGGGFAAAGFPESSGSLSPASLASPSVNWEEEEDGAREDGLARRALRGRERWAYCRSSSAPAPQAPASSSEEEVASSAGGDLWWCAAATRALALKLDYEEILAAWSDRGPLYLDGDAPQVVPQLLHRADPFDSAAAYPVLVEVGQGACGSGGGAASAWKVPEEAWGGGGEGDGAEAKEEENVGGIGGGEIISREARVKRYKEKRSNRLFAKRIRYEVRKMNAEKRPRVKGRFVKRNEEEQEEHS